MDLRSAGCTTEPARGRVGSRPGRPGEEVDYGDSVEFSISANGLTVLQVLNELAKHAAGHPWLVVTSDGSSPRITSFGFLHDRGIVTSRGVSTMP